MKKTARKKATVRVAKPKASLIEVGLRAVTTGFQRRDACSYPGMVLSWLESSRVFYCSIVTYDGPMGQGKHVRFNAKDATLDGAVQACLVAWRTAKAPLDALDTRLKEVANG